MGADGTLGLQAIRGQGGLTLAQRPNPRSSTPCRATPSSSGNCDIVAAPGELAAQILQFVAAGDAAAHPHADAEAAPSLGRILALLLEHGKHDLAEYKPSTLRRRCERRMGVHALPDLAAYEHLLRGNPLELDLLFKEMLIGVTNFFRDPQVWKSLQEMCVPALLARRDPPLRLRAWVAGCSTGEEAYSLAMVFREVVEALPQFANWQLQVFATDLSADAIAFARRGRYPPASPRRSRRNACNASSPRKAAAIGRSSRSARWCCSRSTTSSSTRHSRGWTCSCAAI